MRGCHIVLNPWNTSWYATFVNAGQNGPPTTTEVPEEGTMGMFR
jgi:hypothetical protein